MFNKMLEKRAELKATLAEKKGFQKGFTLVEMLVVLLILAVLIAVLVMQFGFLNKVDGTELIAESKNIESAVLQKALADDKREFPGVTQSEGTIKDNKVVRKADGTSNSALLTANTENTPTTADTKDIISFMVKNGGNYADAYKLYKDVASSAGLTPTELASLVQYVSKDVQDGVAGNAKTVDYLVVVKKSQIAQTVANTGGLANYSDELAGKVFSSITITDADDKVYNGSNVFTLPKAN